MYRLTFLNGSMKGRRVTVREGTVVVGCAMDCPVRLSGEGLAQHHAELAERGPAVWVRALSRAYPVLVNGEPVAEERELHPGDRLRIGPFELSFLRAQPRPGPQGVRRSLVQALTVAAIVVILAVEVGLLVGFGWLRGAEEPPPEAVPPAPPSAGGGAAPEGGASPPEAPEASPTDPRPADTAERPDEAEPPPPGDAEGPGAGDHAVTNAPPVDPATGAAPRDDGPAEAGASPVAVEQGPAPPRGAGDPPPAPETASPPLPVTPETAPGPAEPEPGAPPPVPSPEEEEIPAPGSGGPETVEPMP